MPNPCCDGITVYNLSLSDMGKKTYLVSESLSQQWQRISNKVKLIWSNALAAVCSNGQRISLSIDAKELQVQEAVSEPAL